MYACINISCRYVCIVCLCLLSCLDVCSSIHPSINQSIHSNLSVNPSIHGPLTRYVKLRVTHVPRMPGTFSPPPTNETAIYRSRHASRHVRDTRAVMHGGENAPGIPGACATRSFTYLTRGPLHPSNHLSIHNVYSLVTLKPIWRN